MDDPAPKDPAPDKVDDELTTSGQDPQNRKLRTRQPTKLNPETVNWDDINLDSDNERPLKKVRKEVNGKDDAVKDYVVDSQVEAETGWAVLHSAGLTEEEESILPSGTDEDTYVNVRNHVLTKWRSNVSAWMTEEEAASQILSKHRHLAVLAYNFLTRHGYINFGVAENIKEKVFAVPADKEHVIIVGAGLAGLAAARHLRRLGHKVIVIEGRGRPGGRVYTKRLQHEDWMAVGDLGGSIITGIDGNPLAVLTKQLGIPMHNISSDVPMYMSDGSKADKAMDDKVYKQFNTMLDECTRTRDDMGEVADQISLGTGLEWLWKRAVDDKSAAPGVHRMLFDWHMANLEFANAAKVATLSLRQWDQDDLFEMQGPHVFLPGGNIRLVSAMADGIPIFYHNVARVVQYSEQGVAVHTDSGVFRGDAVLVTAPLGVLKHGTIRFEPPLPQRKLDAIKRLGFGVLNKVVLLFPYVFWEDKHDMFATVADGTDSRGLYYLFYSYAHISGGALLAGLVAGAAAETFEELPIAEAVQRVMALITRIFEPKGIKVPPPLKAVVTRWGQDPMAYGSYSSVAVGSLGADDYDMIAENLGGRVFFAGEHTTKKWPATMHGAFLSGVREAANIAAHFEKAGKEARRHAAGHATKAPAHASMDALMAVEHLSKVATILKLVFQQLEADLEFGSFTALFGPPDTEFTELCLVQLDLGGTRSGTRKPLSVHFSLPRDALATLRDLPNDDARVALLAGDLGVKLMSRTSLGDDALRLLDAIIVHRKVQLDESLLTCMVRINTAPTPSASDSGTDVDVVADDTATTAKVGTAAPPAGNGAVAAAPEASSVPGAPAAAAALGDSVPAGAAASAARMQAPAAPPGGNNASAGAAAGAPDSQPPAHAPGNSTAAQAAAGAPDAPPRAHAPGNSASTGAATDAADAQASTAAPGNSAPAAAGAPDAQAPAPGPGNSTATDGPVIPQDSVIPMDTADAAGPPNGVPVDSSTAAPSRESDSTAPAAASTRHDAGASNPGPAPRAVPDSSVNGHHVTDGSGSAPRDSSEEPPQEHAAAAAPAPMEVDDAPREPAAPPETVETPRGHVTGSERGMAAQAGPDVGHDASTSSVAPSSEDPPREQVVAARVAAQHARAEAAPAASLEDEAITPASNALPAPALAATGHHPEAPVLHLHAAPAAGEEPAPDPSTRATPPASHSHEDSMGAAAPAAAALPSSDATTSGAPMPNHAASDPNQPQPVDDDPLGPPSPRPVDMDAVEVPWAQEPPTVRDGKGGGEGRGAKEGLSGSGVRAVADEARTAVQSEGEPDAAPAARDGSTGVMGAGEQPWEDLWLAPELGHGGEGGKGVAHGDSDRVDGRGPAPGACSSGPGPGSAAPGMDVGAGAEVGSSSRMQGEAAGLLSDVGVNGMGEVAGLLSHVGVNGMDVDAGQDS